MNKLKYAAFLVTLSMGAALAATAPGTSITNTATANYTDPDGGAQTVSSNTVSTTINPLGSFTITLDQTVQTAPSTGNDQGIAATLKLTGVQNQQVVFPYVIANTGNYNDTYNLTTNFANGSAAPTTLTAADYKYYPESTTTPGTPDLAATPLTSISVNAGASKNFYMVVTVPAAAPTGSIAYADPVGTATKTSVTTADGAVTGSGPFTVTPPTENNNNFQYNKLTVNGQANLTVTKTFSKFYSAYTSSTVNTVATGTPKVGDFLEYTITVTNTSATSIASTVSIADVVPAGTQYFDGSTTSGAIAPAAPVAAGATVTATPASGEIAVSGVVTLKYVFKVLNLADTTATPNGVNDPVVNAAKASYKDKTTNTALPDVTGTAPAVNVVGVGVGPSGNPTGAASGTVVATEPAPNAAGLTVTKGGTGVLDNGTGGPGTDNSDIPRAVVKADGTTTDVFFPNTLKNTGTLTDQFTLSSSLGANQTTGTPTVTFYKDAAGTTPLTAADLNLAPGASLTYFTKVTLPAVTPSVDGTAAAPAVSVTVTATSGNNPSVTDTTKDVLEDTDRRATLTGNNTSNPVDNNGVVDLAKLVKNVNPVAGGVQVFYPVDLVNTGLTSDTITLLGNITIPLVGGGNATPTVTYYAANTDGTPNIAGGAITSIPVGAGQEVTVVAVFTVPANAAPTTGTIGIQLNQPFTSAQNGNVPFTPDTSDTGTFNKGDLLTIGVTNAFTFTPDASSRITASGSTVYTHTLTNNSTNSSITGVVFAVAADTAKTTTTLPAGAGLTDLGATLDVGTQSDFTTLYSLDGVTYSATLPTPGTIAPGASITLYVKVADTSSTNVGSVNDVVISATPTFSAGTNPAAQLVEDVTVVKAVGAYNGTPADNTDFALKPLKTVRTCADALCATVLNATGASAVPGNFLEYTIVSKNNRLSASDLKGVIVKDTVPANTTFVSASATTDQATPAGTVLYSSDAGVTWSTTAPSATTTTQLWVGVTTAAPSTSIDTSDVLSTAKTITVKFVVKVN